MFSLRGRRLKGKGKGVLGARETWGAFSVFSLHRRVGQISPSNLKVSIISSTVQQPMSHSGRRQDIVLRIFLPSIYELQLLRSCDANVFKFWCQTETTEAKNKNNEKTIYLLKQDVDSRPQRKLPSRANECVVLGTFSYMSHSSSAAIYSKILTLVRAKNKYKKIIHYQ